jgi:iron complex transport system substrate-binding protein
MGPTLAIVALVALAPACTGAAPGREGPAERVASQIVLADELLWELGPVARSRVVGVSSLADDPTYSAVAGRWPASVPRVVGASEELLALRPELVIVAEWSNPETLALLDRSGTPHLRLAGFRGTDDLRQHIGAIAEALGLRADGDRLQAALERRIERLRADPVAPALRVVAWSEGHVSGAGTTFDDAATLAGLVHVPAREAGLTGHIAVGAERLLAWNPDLLVVPCGTDGCEAARARVLATPGFGAARFAQDGGRGVVTLPAQQLYSTGFGLLDLADGLRAAAREYAAP